MRNPRLRAVYTVPIGVVALALWWAPARQAAAGEFPLLGTILVSDAGTGSNRTAASSAGAPTTYINRTRCSAGFVVTPQSKISVQCDQAAYVGVNVAGCDAGTCVELAAKQFFTTSVGAAQTLTARAWSWDGGSQAAASACVVTYTGAWVAVAPVTGAAAATCRVFERQGNE